MTKYIEQVIYREEMLSSSPNIAHSVKRINLSIGDSAYLLMLCLCLNSNA